MAETVKPPVKTATTKPVVSQIQFVGTANGSVKTINVEKGCCLGNKKGAKR